MSVYVYVFVDQRERGQSAYKEEYKNKSNRPETREREIAYFYYYIL